MLAVYNPAAGKECMLKVPPRPGMKTVPVHEEYCHIGDAAIQMQHKNTQSRFSPYPECVERYDPRSSGTGGV